MNGILPPTDTVQFTVYNAITVVKPPEKKRLQVRITGGKQELFDVRGKKVPGMRQSFMQMIYQAPR
jgi:hypothetical protein